MELSKVVKNRRAQHADNAGALARMDSVPEVEPGQLLRIMHETAILWRLRYARLKEIHSHSKQG